MATVTLTKYDLIQVGDRVTKPNSALLIKSGIVVRIEKLNQHAMTLHLDNGGSLEISRYKPNSYEVYRDRNHIPTA